MRLLRISALAFALASPALAQETAELHASDAAARDFYGRSLTMSGTTVVVGASHDDAPQGDRGSAYVYVGSGSTWTQQAKLLPADGHAADFLGTSVSLSGNYLATGAPGDDVVDNSNTNEGSAYVWVRSAGTWSQQAKLVPADLSPNDLFGSCVALSGSTVAVGAPYDDDLGTSSGSVYVYARTGTTWTLQAKLLAADGSADDLFGSSVGVSGNTVLVGAHRDDPVVANCGSVYVFTRTGTTWSQQAKLAASDAAPNDSFGRALAFRGDTAVIGAYQRDDKGIDSGAAYVFTTDGTNWTERAKLLASDGTPFDAFGRSLALYDGRIVVGACQDRVAGTNSGSAYVFEGSGSTWTETAKLVPAEAAASDFFGWSVAASGAMAVVASPHDDDNAMNSGSLHVFWVDPAVTAYCSSKTSSHGCVPSIGSTGVPSATAASGFVVRADQVEENKPGVLFYSTTGPSSAPFQGGVLCLQSPIIRTAPQNAGTSGSLPCRGVLALDLNASGICAGIGAGASCWIQVWFRDPPSPSTTGLSNALEFAVGP